MHSATSGLEMSLVTRLFTSLYSLEFGVWAQQPGELEWGLDFGSGAPAWKTDLQSFCGSLESLPRQDPKWARFATSVASTMPVGLKLILKTGLF